MFTVKNKKTGLIHDCNTKERYESFKASGWEDYKVPKRTVVDKEKKQNKVTK